MYVLLVFAFSSDSLASGYSVGELICYLSSFVCVWLRVEAARKLVIVYFDSSSPRAC